MTKLKFATNTISAAKEISHDGRSYLVSPVVAIREGVLNGALVLEEEFGKYVESWNGRAVPLNHPKANGEYISANSPDVWAMEVPGHLWNVVLDGDRLRGEIWIDLERAEKIGERAMVVVERLRAGDPIEVSTGYFADFEDASGVWNGKRYFGIHRNIRPDHLALLPDEIGACSWEDGCGTPRVNSLRFATGVDTGEGQRGAGMAVKTAVKTNEMDLNDRAVVVRRAFWERVANGDGLEEVVGDWDVLSVFDGTLIAKDWVSKGHMAFPYTLTDAGVVTFGEATPIEVVYRAKEGGAEVVVVQQDDEVSDREVGLFARFRSWVGQGKGGASSSAYTNEGIEAQKGIEDVKKCELVTALVANKQNKFSKEKLESWSEEDLTALHQSLTANTEAEAPAAVVPVTEPAVAQLPAEVTDFAKMIQGLGGVEKLGAALGAITANADQEKNALVSALIANEQCAFDEAELKAMSVAQLQKYADKLLPRDYSGGVGYIRNSGAAEQEFVMEMPKVNWAVAGEAK